MKRIDLRATPAWERPGVLLSAFEALGVDDGFSFIADSEPRALIMRIEHDHPGASTWSQRHVGGSEWETTIHRIDTANPGTSCLNHLRRTIFSGASEQTQLALANAAQECTAVKGDYIYHENQSWSNLGFLCEGTLSAGNGSPSGRDRTFFEVNPFMAFGIAAALDGGLTFTNMRVISRSAKYLTIPVATIHALAEDDPRIFAAIGFLSAQQSRSLARALNAQVSLTAIGRLAAALLPYAPPEKGMHPALPPLTMLTQTQLAAAAGTVKEVAARAISQLEAKSALRRERGRVRYLDRNKLLEYVK